MLLFIIYSSFPLLCRSEVYGLINDRARNVILKDGGYTELLLAANPEVEMLIV